MTNARKRKPILRLSVALAMLAPLLFASGASGEISDIKRFELFAACKPMHLVVERLPSDASKIGLTREAIQAAVESRLRSARIYEPTRSALFLYVNVNVVGRAHSHSIALEFNKRVHDPLSGITSVATTWQTGSIGTNGGYAGNVLSSVSEHIDEFLVEYLRVNEKACAKRFAAP